MDNDGIVFLVPGETKPRNTLAARIKSLGFTSTVVRSANELLESKEVGGAGCVVLQIAGRYSELKVILELVGLPDQLPVIVVSDAADLEIAVEAMKMGAVDFLLSTHPIARIQAALEKALHGHAEKRRHFAHIRKICRRWQNLPEGHREVLHMLAAGRSNREIAVDFGLSVRAIEARRSKIMATMRAKSLAELVRQTIVIEGSNAGALRLEDS